MIQICSHLAPEYFCCSDISSYWIYPFPNLLPNHHKNDTFPILLKLLIYYYVKAFNPYISFTQKTVGVKALRVKIVCLAKLTILFTNKLASWWKFYIELLWYMGRIYPGTHIGLILMSWLEKSLSPHDFLWLHLGICSFFF